MASSARRQSNLQHVGPPQLLYRTTREGRRLRYELQVIQQPERARACGSGQKCKISLRILDYFIASF